MFNINIKKNHGLICAKNNAFIGVFLVVILVFTLVSECLIPGGVSTLAMTEEKPYQRFSSGSASGQAAATETPTATPTLPPTPTPIPPASDAKLRMMYTTDTHGQITGYDYQRQVEVVRGLDRISTMMKQARAEMGDKNTLAFDMGDDIMDYTTDYIYSQNPLEIQPVYKAIASMKYDAVTLGNHELDYGINYATRQLESSGLMKKLVLSNVKSKLNGDIVFGSENKILEKEVTDNNGNSRIVKVGLFGVTPPAMSQRTENTKNSLKAESIMETAKKEVESLKAQGAEIIVALAHSGVGKQNVGSSAANCGYAMTKIDGIDVILGGHQHVWYPDPAYSYLPGIDQSTWLTNGKRLLCMRDSARGLGIVDLNLHFDEYGNLSIRGSDWDIRKVTKDITPDPAITKYMDEWGKKITSYTTEKIGTIGSKRWTTYLAALESGPTMQVVQNAQRAYAFQYISENAPEYINWPIICASRYGMYGNESGDEYGDVTGELTRGDVQDFARYHQYIYAYEITGAQLKEWIEWSASIYQTLWTSVYGGFEDSTIQRYVSSGGESLLADEYVRSWTSMFRFGGVEYTIDPSRVPRYSLDGRKISESERVVSLTRNGVPIAPEDKFVIACDQILSAIQNDATKGIYSNKIAAQKVLLQDVVASYLKQLNQMGEIDIATHQNWKIAFPEGYRFLLTTGLGGDDILQNSEWVESRYDFHDSYGYYVCKAPSPDQPDTQGPCLSLLMSSYETTPNPVTIKILANDISGVTALRYIKGTRAPTDPNWHNPSMSMDVPGDMITFYENGVYTFYAEDTLGNKTVQSIAINNIDPETLVKPIVYKVDNNDDYVSGVAQPGVTVNVMINGKTYSERSEVTGDFIVDIPVQIAGTRLDINVSDSTGRKSPAVTMFVKSVGPNRPSASASNNSYYITGKTHESSGIKLYAVIGGKVYVSKKLGKNYYKNCKKYNKNKTIVTTSITISKGSYKIEIPHRQAGSTIKVFNVDSVGRVSAVREITVKAKTYEPVYRYPTYSGEKKVYGRIREGKKGYIRAYYSDKSEAGTGYSDENGYFAIPVDRALKDGEKITLIAAKTASDEERSHPSELKIEDLYEADEGDELSVHKVTAADDQANGVAEYKRAVLTVVVPSASSSRTTRADTDGKFSLKLAEKYDEGTKLYFILRTSHGYFIEMKIKRVLEAPPKAPVIESVSKKNLTVHVLHKDEVNMWIRVAGKKYKEYDIKYVESLKRYMYTFEIDKIEDDDKIVAIAKNKGGKTKSKPFIVE